MGLGLDRNRLPDPGRDDVSEAIPVRDAFDLKPSYRLDHAPGVALVLDSCVIEAPRTLIGKQVRVRTPAGRDLRVSIDDVRDHGTTISLFIKDFTSQDLPVGSLVELELG